MKEITKLVNEWDAFESEHSEATIEDFCRYYLVKTRQDNKNQVLGGRVTPEINSSLGKLFGRLNAINAYYFKNSNKEHREIDLTSFGLLNSIYFRKEAKKTDAINDIFMELSTGIDVITRLKKKSLVAERNDPDDKRAKLIKLTSKGEKALNSCRADLGKISQYMYGEMNIDEKKTIFNLLSNIESKHTQKISENNLQDLWVLFNKEKKFSSHLR
jgi:DNA-binding MarR family transcriptional regulator